MIHIHVLVVTRTLLWIASLVHDQLIYYHSQFQLHLNVLKPRYFLFFFIKIYTWHQKLFFQAIPVYYYSYQYTEWLTIYLQKGEMYCWPAYDYIMFWFRIIRKFVKVLISKKYIVVWYICSVVQLKRFFN